MHFDLPTLRLVLSRRHCGERDRTDSGQINLLQRDGRTGAIDDGDRDRQLGHALLRHSFRQFTIRDRHGRRAEGDLLFRRDRRHPVRAAIRVRCA